uniref:Uncharacterized protein LOC8268106 isoform X1 n=1 Tax=Rhizophora mucronata TaxID=61149 RepID=A0A2P2L9L5_RHIMU
MEIGASKVSSNAFVNQRKTSPRSDGTIYSFAKPLQQSKLHQINQKIKLRQLNSAYLLTETLSFSGEGLWGTRGQPVTFIGSWRSSKLCLSMGTHKTEEAECASGRFGQEEVEHPVMHRRIIHSSQALAEACKYVCNDAKFVNERARNDIILLSRGIMRLDARARKDVAILGSEFLKLDARVREDTEKIDRDVKKKAEHLHQIATILKDKAQSRLKNAADKHWSDGALEVPVCVSLCYFQALFLQFIGCGVLGLR